MKRFLPLLLCLLSLSLYADDIIVLRTNEKVIAIIEEVGPDYIKYHKKSSPNGPLFRLESHEIATILYGNGDVQTFEVAPAPAPEPAPAQPQADMGANPYAAYPQNVAPAMGQGAYYMPDYMRRDSIRKAKKEARKVMIKALPARHFLLFNYAITSNKASNVGFTYGWCKLAGVYVNMMFGTGTHYPSRAIERWSSQDSYWFNSHQLTNTHTNQRISVTPGAMIRFGKIPLYANLGLGYAYMTTTYKTIDGLWTRLKGEWQWYDDGMDKWVGRNYSEHNLNFQFGLMADIKGFSLMANYSLISSCMAGDGVDDVWHEFNIGVGMTLPLKKGGKK